MFQFLITVLLDIYYLYAQVSGLSAWMGSQLAVLDFLDARVLVLIVIIGTSFATEVTSNVATCSILLPVLRDLVSGTLLSN